MFSGMGHLPPLWATNLFQCFTTLIVKNFFLITSLYLLYFSLKPLPLVLSQQALLKHLSPSFVYVQELALGLAELHEVHMGPPLKPVKVPLDDVFIVVLSASIQT